MNDGWLYKRTFDGTTLGAATQVHPERARGPAAQRRSSSPEPRPVSRRSPRDIASMTGMFYDNGRIYYTVAKTGTASANNNKLYYRYFNPESEIVGASLFVASTGGEGINWGNVRGMTLASGKLIYALTDGRLYRVNWEGTKPTGAVTQISSATDVAVARDVRLQPGDGHVRALEARARRPARARRSTRSTSRWPASTDNSRERPTYRVYRDGGADRPGRQLLDRHRQLHGHGSGGRQHAHLSGRCGRRGEQRERAERRLGPDHGPGAGHRRRRPIRASRPGVSSSTSTDRPDLGRVRSTT